MRFITLVKSAESFRAGPPPKALMDAIGKLGEEATKEGVLVDMGGLSPSNTGARIRLAKGKLTLTDGPFAEAKEVIGGYAIFELKSRKEAIERAMKFMELHQRHWKGWEGETEVRQLMGPADFGPRALP